MFSSERLKEAREKKGLTQPELAKLVGKSQSAISYFESGAKTPSGNVSALLSDVLEVSIDWLYGKGE